MGLVKILNLPPELKANMDSKRKSFWIPIFFNDSRQRLTRKYTMGQNKNKIAQLYNTNENKEEEKKTCREVSERGPF